MHQHHHGLEQKKAAPSICKRLEHIPRTIPYHHRDNEKHTKQMLRIAVKTKTTLVFCSSDATISALNSWNIDKTN
jgi:hypothetical protein